MSDRYQFLKDYTDPLNPSKVFKAGSVARLSDSDGQTLTANGTVKSVLDFTPQRKNVFEPNGCTQLTVEQLAEIEPIALSTNKHKK